MLGDAKKFAASCPEGAVVTGSGRVNRPPLHPIPVSSPFQVLGIDVMDLPPTDQGNKHVAVIQDLFTKWPMVYVVPDQKTTRIASLIAEEVIPIFSACCPIEGLTCYHVCWSISAGYWALRN